MSNYKNIIVPSLGGFQFGYNTGVISGALLFLTTTFGLSLLQEGQAVGIILIGALFGSIFAGTFTNRFGRRGTLMGAAALLLFGSLIAGCSPTFDILLAGRFIQGIGVGVVSLTTPMYLAEIAPPKQRGIYVSANQLAITVGILAAYVCNYLFSSTGNWRWMLGLGAVPAFLQLIGLFFIPESPVWVKKDFSYQASWKNLLNPIFRKALIAGLLLNIFQQITGINAVIYFAPKIFQDAGYSTASGAILASVGIGVINVIATIFSLWLIDKAGRRPLLFWSLSGMAVSLLISAIALFTESKVVDIIAIFSLMAYVASFAIGMGPIPWLINAEIYPIAIRGQAMSLATFANWLSNYLVALTFLDLAAVFGTGSTFCLYAFLSLIALWFIAKRIPETKGKTLDEISRGLQLKKI